MSPIVKSPIKQAGGEPECTWGIYRHECTCSGNGGEMHVLRFRSSAWEHVPYPVVKEGSCHISFVESTLGRVGSFLPGRTSSSQWAGQNAPRPAEVLSPIYCLLWAHPFYKSAIPDLSIQVGRSAGVWAEWVNSVFLRRLARWTSKNGLKVDLFFGPRSWVRTI
ncbi:hypothetical protein PIB30_017861 [Stylosanthes scabra]|uniref:Uncharacterized protein n=1 Tax=Stylosanthes scabra TaxID=79078 RepID=A0ABU6X9A5_9FABA|nr:hypothetical protein [Stylosanthes scabra]